jgi:predicted TIM-barrel fold metal-dependent hydrolase
MCQVYNDWLYEYCQVDATRLRGVALLPLQDPGEAANELRRAVQALRCVAGVMIPNPVIGRRLHDGAYDVLYREAETLGVPLVVSHGGSGMVLPQVGQDRWQAFYAREVAVDIFEAWLAVASFMGHNVLERFPGLHIGFIGAGCGWLPYWLERLEEHWGGFFGQDAPSTQAPDRVFKAQGFVACDPWEQTVPEVVEAMGERAVVWGSQYPLPDILHFFPNEVQILVEDRHLAEEAKQRILWENAADLFHIGEGPQS